jgi:hypothetical protein
MFSAVWSAHGLGWSQGLSTLNVFHSIEVVTFALRFKLRVDMGLRLRWSGSVRSFEPIRRLQPEN